MTFNEYLRTFIGRTAEILQVNQFYTGQIIAVTDSILTLQIGGSQYYYGPPVYVNIVISNITTVRILAA